MYSAASTQPHSVTGHLRQSTETLLHSPGNTGEMPWAVHDPHELMGPPLLCVSPGMRGLSLESSSKLTASPF